jgi:protein ImuB
VPELLTLERRKNAKAAALLGLADWGTFHVVAGARATDSLLLEVSGSLRLFGDLERLLRQMEDELAERGHAHLDGLAPTPAGAALLARARPCTPANIPSWCAGGDPAAFHAGLGELPLELLEVPDRQRLRMQRMGFSRIGAFSRAARRARQAFRSRISIACALASPDPRLPHQPRISSTSSCSSSSHCTIADAAVPAQRAARAGQFSTAASACQRLDWRLRDISGRTLALGLPCRCNNSHAALSTSRA